LTAYENELLRVSLVSRQKWKEMKMNEDEIRAEIWKEAMDAMKRVAERLSSSAVE